MGGSRIRDAVVVLAAAFLGMSCGGGGGGGSDNGELSGPPTVSSENAKTAAGLVTDAADSLIEVAGTSGDILEQTEEYVESGTGLGRAAADPVDVSTLVCPGGGRATLDLTDEAPTGELSGGDRVTVTFQDCVGEDDGSAVTFDGVLTMSVRSAEGDYGAQGSSFEVDFSFQGFSVDGWTVNGGFSATFEAQAGGALRVTVAGDSLTVSAPEGASVSCTNFVCTATADPASDAYTLDLDGTVSGSGVDGELHVETSDPFAWTDDNDPTSGRFTATASDGSSLTFEAHADGTVTITVDEDGDGSADATIETTWDEIGS